MITDILSYLIGAIALISMGMVIAGIYTMLLGYGTNNEDAYNVGMRGMKMGLTIGYAVGFLYFGGAIL